MNMIPNLKRKNQIINSMLWSAWGDVVGFPAELISEKQYLRRTSGKAPGTIGPWRKTVGGRFGVDVSLPKGAYSDDTQLRLATARAIRSNGEFDVEVFSKIELPVWLSYALGAGRGSKAAANSLISSNIAWFSNFYDNKYGRYVNGGGNGAAMRVQPHVWSCRDLSDPVLYLTDVVKNSLCTHGHVRGILGAMIHAEHLAYTLRTGCIPSSETWLKSGDQSAQMLLSIVEMEDQLKNFWRPTWEKNYGKSLAEAVQETTSEWDQLVKAALDLELIEPNPASRYERLVVSIGGMDPSTRGSGLLTTLISVAGASWLEAEGEIGALTSMGTFFGSDTDTIASMAGALIGACSINEPPKGIQDEAYLQQVAERLFDISQGTEVDDFIYPDLLYWQPPKTALDTVLSDGRAISLAGLGRISEVSEHWPLPREGGAYRWFVTWFGQSILCKYRNKVSTTPESMNGPGEQVLSKSDLSYNENLSLFNSEKDKGISSVPIDVDWLTDHVIKGGFDAKTIGEAILRLSESKQPIEDSIAFVAIIVKARIARNRRA